MDSFLLKAWHLTHYLPDGDMRSVEMPTTDTATGEHFDGDAFKKTP